MFIPSLPVRFLPGLLFIQLLLCASAEGQAARPGFDVILRHGTVVDGTGGARFAADVGLQGGFIAAVGDLKASTAVLDLDLTGLVVSPGFINLHSHATPEGLRRGENMLTQGVTTEILNADGGGPLDLASQLRSLESAGLALNAGANIGFNSVWIQVMGAANQRPSPEAIDRMRALVRQGLEQGAFGVSAGLDYKPGYYATTEEVEKIVSVARPFRTVFTNHERLTPETGYSSRVGIAETIAIGEHAGLVPLVTHMKAQGMEQGTATTLLATMDAAAARGAYTAADVYPYLAGQTGLAALIIPGWAQEGGRDAMLARFQDPQLRSRIGAEAEQAMKARFGGPQGVYATGPATELVDAMKAFGVTSPGEALIRLLEKGDGGAILRFGIESDLISILRHETASVACDCGAVDGPSVHPRYYGTFPRVLGRYVREQKVLSLEDAVRKMTGLPAATIGLVDRGLLAPGMAADLAVFDPASIIDRATFEAPTERSVGVRHVFVNGRIALRDGVATGATAGRSLFRSAHEPSRPMAAGERRVGLKMRSPKGRISLDVSLKPSARRPRGGFKMTFDGVAAELTEPWALFVTKGWASVVGVGTVNGERGPVTVILEGRNPSNPGPGATLTVRGPGGYSSTHAIPAKALRLDSVR